MHKHTYNVAKEPYYHFVLRQNEIACWNLLLECAWTSISCVELLVQCQPSYGKHLNWFIEFPCKMIVSRLFIILFEVCLSTIQRRMNHIKSRHVPPGPYSHRKSTMKANKHRIEKLRHWYNTKDGIVEKKTPTLHFYYL